MNEEQSARLSQEMFDAKTEEDRARVLVHWLPELVRCQIKTAARCKLLVEDNRRLEAKVDTLHADPKPSPKFREDPLGWLKLNWQWLVLFLLLIKSYGLTDGLAKVFALFGGTP